MGFPIISMFRRVQRDNPDPVGRQVGLWLLAGLIAMSVVIWVTIHQRDIDIPEIPFAEEHPSTPMPSGHLDRG